MNNTHAHQELVDQILIAVGSHPRVRLWPRRVGVAIPLGKQHPVRFGIPGETDLQGIIAPWGRLLAIEVKTGSGRLSKDQARFRNMIEKFGGLYVEARSVEDALQAVLGAIES